MKRKLLSLLLVALLLFSCSAYANTFIVTSNADSGPGTLREALQTAAFNGTTVYDTILFNLPGSTFADRTITIFGTLVLSSKVIVDGTSQPGTNFGVSDAKIILNRGVELCTGLFMSNEDNIGLYGIWFKNFDYIDNLTGDCHGYSIMMNHVKNIAVGKLNKGNAFSNQNINSIFHKNYFGIDYLNPIAFADTINIEYNYFGLDDAGLGLDNVNQEGISLWNGRNVIINHNYGNCYAAVGSASETGNGYIRFTNNNFSNPINSQIHGKGALAVTLQGLTAQFVTYDLTITGNKITNDNQYCIIIWDMHGSILIDNNVLGEFYDIQNEPDLNFGIGVIRCVTSYTGKITNNVIQNRKKGVWLVNCGKVFISKNSIFCTDKGIDIQNPIYNVPVVSLKNITSTSIEGQTSPGLKVELFYTDTCINLCENGKFYLGNTIADANGIFSFPYTGIGLISATTSTVDSITSEFNGVKVDTIHAVVKNATCGVNNGSITGIVILNASSWQWENELGQVISTIDTNLYNLSPGKYRLILQEANVSCPVITRFFEILSYPQPVLTGNPFQLTQPNCGLSNGKIVCSRTRPTGAGNVWMNETNSVLEYNTDELDNLPPGDYYYKLFLFEDTMCYTIYGPFSLINQSGPSLNTNDIQITNSTCTSSNGSIINITASNVTGTPFILWLDSLNNIVGTTLDLLNQPAGKYKLKFKDQSGCDTIITPFYVIPATGRITIDTAGKIITKAGCTVNNGSISNIKVAGADNYQWQNLTTNTSAGNTIDIYNLSAGNYQLMATNVTGCSAVSPVISVSQTVFIPIGVTGTQTRVAVCGENNGLTRITSFNNDSNLYSFRWIDSATNQQLATGTALYNIGAGTYLLIAADSNGCEKQIYKSALGAYPKPTFDFSDMIIKDDKCAKGEGGITGIKLNDFPVPITYTWRDINNNVAGSSIDLLNVSAGQYYLTVTDGILCSIQSSPFTITNNNDPGIILQYDDQVIPRNTSATITIKNFQPGTYFLYSDPAGTQLLQQNTTGNFSTGLLISNADYYVRLVSGACTSSIAHIKITVVDKSFFAIASGFTPNNDGKNDRLYLNVIGYIDVEYFKIYNRNGEEVFSTRTINDGWEGRYKGSEQPTGVFVWMAKGKDINGKTVTSKGTFVLIR